MALAGRQAVGPQDSLEDPHHLRSEDLGDLHSHNAKHIKRKWKSAWTKPIFGTDKWQMRETVLLA
jgi:hypothetical protein